ncbi:hypothetical protein Tco_0044277 [Tanacetum coccineum]
MVDSQPEREGVQWVEEEGTRKGSREGPSAPTLLAQTTPSSAFIKENIDMLRIMIKEHDQQTKTKATPKKLTYDDFEVDGSESSKGKGLSERSSDGSSGTAETRNKSRSYGKSRRSLPCNKSSSYLRRYERLGKRSRSKAKAKEGRAKSRTRRSGHKETSSNFDYEEDSEDTCEDLSLGGNRKRPYETEESRVTKEIAILAIPRNSLTDAPIILKGMIKGFQVFEGNLPSSRFDRPSGNNRITEKKQNHPAGIRHSEMSLPLQCHPREDGDEKPRSSRINYTLNDQVSNG